MTMVERISKVRVEVLKRNYEPEMLIMNELDLRRLKDALIETYKPGAGWKSAVGGRLMGMLVVFDPEVKEIIITYNSKRKVEQIKTI